jgi:hypothetical protein
VDKALWKGWDKVLHAFEVWNLGGASQGEIQPPQISDERRTAHVDLGGGWQAVMKAQHGGYEDDEPGDFMTVKLMNPLTKSADLVYEGPERNLGLSTEDWNEMVDIVYDAIAIAALAGDIPS